METGIPVSCNRDCIGGCPLLAHVKDGRITRIGNNPLAGPYMSGCSKGFQAARLLYAPDRLQQPLLRTGPRGSGDFRPITWPEALDLIADRLTFIRARYGARSIIRLGGSGACRGALHHTGRLTARFLALFGGCTETSGSYSAAAAHFVTPFILGTALAGIDPGALQFSNLIILWGANISDCRLGAEMEARLREARKRGVSVIVIDPRRTATVRQFGTQWIPVRPGTDSALMMAVLYVLLAEHLVDEAFAQKYSIGFADLAKRILGGGPDGLAKTPQWAEAICGTPAETIFDFARRYGSTRPAALLPGLSLQRTVGGEEAVRLAIALQVATGNLGIQGGSSGAFAQGHLPWPRVGRIDVPAVNDQVAVPVYRWADAVLEGTDGGYPSDIRAIYNVGGNYLSQGSDVRKNIRAYEKVEFSVCHDLFLTPTARYCDIVLPTTHWLERQDILFPSGNFLLFSNRAVAPLANARDDYEIFCQLAERLGFLSEFSEGKDEEAWLRSFVVGSEIPDYDEFRRTGIYLGQDQARVAFGDFVADPERHPLATPSGRVEILSQAFAEQTGFSALPECRILPASERYPLRLITPHPRHRIHSQGGGDRWFLAQDEPVLWIHPHDAARRHICDGSEVLMHSPEGRIRLRARLSDDMMPGVVCLLEGVWPAFEPDGTDTAGSANVVTSTEPTLPSQGSRTHSVLVEVSAT